MSVASHRSRPSPSLPSTPARLGLSAFPSWRPGQRQVVQSFLQSSRPYVMLEAPTGSGKSLIAVAAARAMGARLLYVVYTRQLQEQLARDFPVAVIMGRNNYPTANHPSLTAEACELRPGRRHCPHCCSPRLRCSGPTPGCDAPSRCPYLRARALAEDADMVVTNVAYLLHDLEAGGGLVAGREILVIDEADELPSALVQHLTVHITADDLALLGMGPPHDPSLPGAWQEWASEALRALDAACDRLSELLEADDDPFERAGLARDLHRLQALQPRLERLAAGGRSPWVAAVEDPRWGPFTLRPLYPAAYARGLLWGRAEGRCLLMSATVLDPAALARDLGLPQGSWEHLSLPSPIPPERRPVVYMPVAPLSHTNAADTWPLAVRALDRILDRHRGERGIVHTQSYRLAAYVMSHSRHRRRLLGHQDAAGRSRALRRHAESEDAVLISPSMERGVDFAGDRARFAVVLKAPYPNLSDPWVEARLRAPGGQEWYARETVRALVQACGRVCRGPDDYGVTYILDAGVGRLLARHRRLFPQWFLAALREAPDGAALPEVI